MSMISEQVKEIRNMANVLHEEKRYAAEEIMRQSADTIEALSAKLQAANDELNRWHTDHVNEKIKNPFAWTSTLICHNCDHKDEYIEELEAELEELKASNMENGGGWIACEDGLPDKSGSYLVTTYSNGILQYISDIDHFVYNGMPDGYWINGEDVIAWQPLPEPYRP